MDNSIKLTKREKKVLFSINNGTCNSATGIPYEEPILRAVVKSLDEKGLVKAILTKDGTGARLTDAGTLLLHDNPRLRTPLDWVKIHSWVNTAIALFASIISLIAVID